MCIAASTAKQTQTIVRSLQSELVGLLPPGGWVSGPGRPDVLSWPEGKITAADIDQEEL